MRQLMKKHIQRRIIPYVQASPEIILYEAVSKLILLALVFVLKKLMMWSVYRTGRVAVSSGDFTFLFKSPWGWVAILTALILCGVYIAFDINVIVNYAGEKMKDRPAVLWKIVIESLTESARFFTPGGLLVLFYATLIAPIIGVGMSISLTKNIYIPNFISEVIRSNTWYNAAYIAFEVLMIAVGILGMFTIHGMVIDHVAPVRSYIRSAKMVINNFWDLLWQMLVFILKFTLVELMVLLAALSVPAVFMYMAPTMEYGVGRIGAIALMLFSFVIILGTTTLYLPMLTMKLTQLYYQYSDDLPVALQTPHIDNFKQMIVIIGALYMFSWSATFIVQQNFNFFFPPEIQADVIGHRGAGVEGAENTVSGIEKAKELGCYGAEIDIQRTADGYYILNHDNTFKRVAGVNKTPSEMTLSEIKALRLNGMEQEKVPTIEEALDASGTDIVLFIELKGTTADKKMCDDMVHLIKERHLEEYCVLISLKYNLIEYIEDRYPEIQTGYLAFITWGNVGALNCDYLGLEEEAATSNAISAAHENGRKVMVWTPNSASSQKRFLMSDADAIITDQTSQANDIFTELEDRDDLTRMFDTLMNYILS